MNTRPILYAAGTLLVALAPAPAGSRSGGSGATAVTIPADTVNSGGGSGTGGSGATAVTVTASSMGNVIGTATAASPATTNLQGYIPQIMGLAGFDLWASLNIPPGQDASFTGDWNRDGIINGVAYVFGNTRPAAIGGQPAGTGRIAVPPTTPPDVTIRLELSVANSGRPLTDWWDIVTWTGGNAPTFRYPNSTSIVGSEVVDRDNVIEFFYRYRVTKP